MSGKKVYVNPYITRASPHLHRCNNDASEFEQHYLEHRRQFQNGNVAIDFVGNAQNRILETTGCCYGQDCEENDKPPSCCVFVEEAGGEYYHKKTDEDYGFSAPISSPKTGRSARQEQHHFDESDDERDDVLFAKEGKKRLSGWELEHHKHWVDSIPDHDLSMMAADNCHRRLGGNQEWAKAYAPLYSKRRLNLKNLHNQGEKTCDEMKEPEMTAAECRWRNMNKKKQIKPQYLVEQETSQPRFQQSCAKRGYVDPNLKRNDLDCDVWAGKKYNNCRDCKFF